VSPARVEGARLFLIDVDAGALDGIAASLDGSELEPHAADVTDPEAWASAAASSARFAGGTVDGFFNNAAFRAFSTEEYAVHAQHLLLPDGLPGSARTR